MSKVGYKTCQKLVMSKTIKRWSSSGVGLIKIQWRQNLECHKHSYLEMKPPWSILIYKKNRNIFYNVTARENQAFPCIGQVETKHLQARVVITSPLSLYSKVFFPHKQNIYFVREKLLLQHWVLTCNHQGKQIDMGDEPMTWLFISRWLVLWCHCGGTSSVRDSADA